MRCPRCGQENPPNAKFCLECATPLRASCSSCGVQLPPGAKFCVECAHPVAAAQPVPTAPKSPPRFAAPDRYTPQHLAEKILTSKSALEGERKQVVVLFADLKGSMELLAERDPEEARMLLDPVLERMMEAVHRYEGTVNQVMGDGIMALSGAPVAHEDHAIRACYAALRLQDSVRRYAEDVHRTAGVPIQIRVGLNSGEVVVRSIGNDLRMDYTAVGQTTHLAARMEQMAVPGTILMAPETLRHAEGFVTVKSLGQRAVKGLEAPVEIYEVVGASVIRSRLQASAARGLTRFVGRESEIDQLRHAIELAGAARGQVVAVVGDPGIGKSRLYWEFVHSHRTLGWLIVESSSVSYGRATAYLPIIELLKTYFQIDTHDDARKIGEKVTGKVLSLDRTLESSLPALLWLLDVPVDDPQWQVLDPPQRRQRTLDGVKRLLLRESQVQPLLIVFEDLHWIDAETQALLDSLVEGLPTARMLLLVNYRPEYTHGWSNRTYYRQLRIDPLPAASADALLAELLGDDGQLEPLKRVLIQRTEGNPFFLEESVRTLVETGVLAGERGAHRLAKAQQDFQIPATAQAILAARIDRLSPQNKRLLQAASAIGKDVPYTLLEATADDAEDGVRASLASLQAAEFLYEARLFPDLEYTFKHALTQEVAYKSLPLERRRMYHGRIARALEAAFPDRLDEKADLLAHHYQQSGDAERALAYLITAAQRATSRFSSEEASRCYALVFGCLDQLPRTDERERQRIDLRLGEVEMVWVQGRYEQGWRILEEIQAVAERLGDRERLAQIHFRFGWYLFDQMELDRAFAHHQTCFALCEELGQLDVMRRVYWGLGTTCRSISVDVDVRRAKSIEFHQQGLLRGEAVAAPDFFDIHFAHFLWLIHLFQLGQWDTAVAFLQRAEAIARRLPEGSDAVHLALMRGSIGLSRLLKERSESSLTMLRESLRVAEQAGSHIYTTISHYVLGQGLFLVGHPARALAHFQATLAIAQQTGNLFLPGALLWSAETKARLESYDEALDHLADYEKLLERVGPLEGLAWFPSQGVAHRIYALISSRQREPTKAAAHFARSLELLIAHGYRPDLARTYVALGEFERDRGRVREAREAFERAAAAFREMGFTFELQQALGMAEAIELR